MSAQDNLNPMQFYHGTNAALQPGDVVAPGQAEPTFNYDRPETHAYLTTKLSKAWTYADFRASNKGGNAAVYEVSPEGRARRDPEGVEGNYRARRATVLRAVEPPPGWEH